jgi:hypothetical protein
MKYFIFFLHAIRSNSIHPNKRTDKTMKLLLRTEAAAQLRISLNALTHLVRDGKIKQIHVTKCRRAILQSEVERYVDSLNL